jgi:hypothetical protein
MVTPHFGGEMQPYVICEGDYLLKLAFQYGFDADAVWNDEKNADLRAARQDHNILFPSDVLYIPDQIDKEPDHKDLAIGTTNAFVSDVPTVPLSIRFTDAQFASQPCTIDELEALSGLTTTGDGLLTFPVPVTMETATINFTELQISCVCHIGALDPIDSLSGMHQRLQNLGFIDRDTAFDPANLWLLRAGLCGLIAAQSTSSSDSQSGGGDASSGQDNAEAPASAPGDAPSDPQPASGSSADAATDGSAEGAGGTDSGSSAAGGPSPSTHATGGDADQDGPPSGGYGPGGTVAGLTDQGKLDAVVSKLLFDAHGC